MTQKTQQASKKQKKEKKQKKAEEAVQFVGERVPPRLKERYRDEVLPALTQRFGYRNVMEVPRLIKVSVNAGIGEATQDAKILESAMSELAVITGQRPAITRAKKSIAAFKVRAKMPVGCRVTLRGDRMWEFVDRLFTVVLPRIRDFRGLPSRSIDGRGNYSLGLREQLVFPEVDLDKVDRVRGMDITIVTTARSDEEALALLTMLGLPVREAT